MWVGIGAVAVAFLVLRALVVAHKSGGFAAFATLMSLGLGGVGLGGVLVPFFEGHVLEAVAALLAVLSVAVLWRPEPVARALAAIPGTLPGRLALTVCWATIIPFGGAEWMARMATDAGLVDYYKPLHTVYVNVPLDQNRPRMVADPVLFWRPRDAPPYNRQGFKGPIVELPKPDGVFRIVTYGDSNTAGTDTVIWPAELQRILELERGGVRRWEVLNGGVHGYSSYQGLMRFRQEVERFEPDLVLVSFGWNNVADARGQPDRVYESRPDIVTGALGAMLRYRLFLVSLRYLGSEAESATDRMGHRVSLSDYRENVRGFQEEAQQHGVSTLLLTRPHRASTEEILQSSTWRTRVPFYNRALVEHADRSGTPVVDVQAFFEQRAPALFIDECHFTREGHRVMSRLVYDELIARGLVP